MKLITREEADAQYAATVKGGIKGFAVGTAVALPTAFILNQRWPYYRHLQPSLKALGAIMIIVPAFVISAEHAGQKFERDHWTGVGANQIEIARMREAKRWDTLSPTDKVQDWAARHQWTLVLGGWATAMATSFSIISRNPYQTTPQKVVQARLWAQGLTLGVVLASAYVAHQSRKKRDADLVVAPQHRVSADDQTWRDVIEAGQKAEASGH